jgi:hypothetical protein
MDDMKPAMNGDDITNKPTGSEPVETGAQEIAPPPVPASSGGHLLRNFALGSVVLFFTVATITTVLFAMGLNQTNKSVVEPVGDLVRQLMLPVTPVIIPNPTTILREIKDLSRLETASFEFEKIITAETKQDILWGALGESLIFVANGKVFAGVDFADMADGDIQVYDPVTVYVHMPEAQIFEDVPVLNNDLSYVADRDTGILTRADPNLETQVRQSAEQAIRDAADESQILQRADNNAREFMTAFLSELGFENIIFTDERPEPAPPFVQEVPKGFAITPAAPTE